MSILDRLARPRIGPWNSYSTLGLAGIAVGYVSVLVVTLARGEPPWTAALVVLTSVVVLILAGYASRASSGREEYVLYRNVLQVLTAVGLVAWFAGRPVLAVLDATMIGLATFLVFGRVGCLMAGCCHGRPARWGIRYTPAHVAAGLPRYHLGQRLMPIQLVEAALAAALVVGGLAAALSPEPPGTALALVLGIYGVARFGLEFLRGDPERPFALGLSEAQWSAVALAWGVVGLTLALDLRWAEAYLGGALSLTVAGAAVATTAAARPGAAWLVTQAPHVRDLLALADGLERIWDGEVVAGETSRGVRLSFSREAIPGGVRRHYALSHVRRALSRRAGQALAHRVLWRHTPDATWEIVPGQTDGVTHLIVDESFRAN